MTAIAQERPTFGTTSGVTRELPKYFYTWMAGLCMLVAFAGFTPTCWRSRVSESLMTVRPDVKLASIVGPDRA